MSHIIILGAKPRSLINFRGDLIKSLVQAGHRVTAMSAPAEPKIVQGVEDLGASFRSYPVNRRGQNPVQDVRTMLALRKIFAELSPDIVLAYTIKPVIWGGLALRGQKNATFFALITGLGFAFQGQNLKRRIMTALATRLYRSGLAQAQTVIFQNPDNRDVFIQRRIVDEKKYRIVPGSGVNTQRFAQAPLPSSDPVFLSIGRLLGEKGFREFARAAGMVKEKYPRARFQILGGEDPSPDGISHSEIKEWEDQGLVEYLGVTMDVRPYLTACHVYVLASYYGEGLPRTIIEAMAVGRPVITTDNVGCRETVVFGDRVSDVRRQTSDVGGRTSDIELNDLSEQSDGARGRLKGRGKKGLRDLGTERGRDGGLKGRKRTDVGCRMSDVDERNNEESLRRIRQGKNGFLVPVKDALSLARTMERFIHEPELAKEMGRESRRMAEERFDVHKINQQMMEIMGASGAI